MVLKIFCLQRWPQDVPNICSGTRHDEHIADLKAKGVTIVGSGPIIDGIRLPINWRSNSVGSHLPLF